jgi:hypothetical protein
MRMRMLPEHWNRGPEIAGDCINYAFAVVHVFEWKLKVLAKEMGMTSLVARVHSTHCNPIHHSSFHKHTSWLMSHYTTLLHL